MKLSIKGLALATGILWGAALLLVALGHHFLNGYGGAFLESVSSIYPGYKVGGGVGAAVIVAAYGLVDGMIAGAILAWLYNLSSAPRVKAP